MPGIVGPFKRQTRCFFHLLLAKARELPRSLFRPSTHVLSRSSNVMPSVVELSNRWAFRFLILFLGWFKLASLKWLIFLILKGPHQAIQLNFIWNLPLTVYSCVERKNETKRIITVIMLHYWIFFKFSSQPQK